MNANLALSTARSSARILISVSVFVLICPYAGPVGAQIVANGDFELPTILDGTYLPSAPTGWVGGYGVVNPDSSGHYAGGGGATWPQPVSGQQYEDIGDQAQTALSQTFSILAAGTYALAWRDNTALGLPAKFQTSPYNVTMVNSSLQQIVSSNFDAYQVNGLWGQRALFISLPAGLYTLRYTSTNSLQGADALIDALSLTAVPEPSSALMLSVGLAAFLLGRSARVRRVGA